MTPTTTEASPLSMAEVGGAVALWRACGLTRPWNDPTADARLALESPGSTILALRTPAGQVVATVMVGFDGHRAWAYYVAVHPGLRRAGLGRALMRAAEDWAAAHGAAKIELMVRRENAPALGFYAAAGYAVEPVEVLSRRLDGRRS